MGLAISQVQAGTAATSLCQVPAGPCLVVITNDSDSANSAYVGITPSGGALTTTNGIPVPAGQSLVFARYKGDPAHALSVVTSGSASVGFLISSASGGTGL